MKNELNTSRKDNVAAATVLAATFFAIAGTIVTSNDAQAIKAVPQMEVQRMETIFITAPRLHQVARMETIVVTASRVTDAAPKLLMASK